MEENKEIFGMLDLMLRPSFCVKENKIVKLNPEAEGLLLTAGTDVRTLLLTGRAEYAEFTGGCLYLKLGLSSRAWGATVTRVDAWDIFILDPESDDVRLQAMALAARELREALSKVMIAADRLLPVAAQDASTGDHAARLNRGLYQMLRIIGNMSDAGHYAATSRQETRDIGRVFAEILEKAQAFVEQAGICLTYSGLSEPVFGLVDADQLERAVLNILSNAVKFTPAGGTISANLTRSGHMLRLSILDNGAGIAETIRNSVFSRYLRQPGIEDSRFGLGLGMVLVRSAAANHGGAVLIDQPPGSGTRVTMTLALRQNTDGVLRSPVLHPDYAGGWDHALVELADCLPARVYEREK